MCIELVFVPHEDDESVRAENKKETLINKKRFFKSLSLSLDKCNCNGNNAKWLGFFSIVNLKCLATLYTHTFTHTHTKWGAERIDMSCLAFGTHLSPLPLPTLLLSTVRENVDFSTHSNLLLCGRLVLLTDDWII